MNRFRSIVAPEQLAEGDIIEYTTQGTLMERRSRPLSRGYVHHIEYNAQRNDEVVSIRVLPVVGVSEINKSDFKHHVLNHNAVGNALGLDQNKDWAVTLAPLTILPVDEQLGRRDGMVQRIGSIAGTLEQKQLLEHIDNIGGDEQIYHDRFGGPREARMSQNIWGLYAPVGIKKDRFEESEFVQAEPKRRYKKKARYEGQVLDMDLSKAVDALGLDASVVDLFEKPADGRLKKIGSLRALNDLLAKDPETAEKYMPKEKTLPDSIPLAGLEDEIHIGVINGLAEPRKGAAVQPVTDLQNAFELVTARPEELAQYMYMGPKMQEYAKTQIPAAFAAHAASVSSAAALDTASAAIKGAWKCLVNAYSDYMISKTVPEAFQGADGQPVWKMVPKGP